MSGNKKMTMEEVRLLESLLKTCDRFGLMPKYTVMLERWTKNIGHWSYVDSVRRALGITISVVGEVPFRIEIVEDEDGN